MTTSSGTDSESTDKEKTGVVPPESQGEKQQAPGDDYVKKSQFIAALNSATAKAETAEARAATLERELKELKAKVESPPAKPVTLAELRQHVEAGSLTQDQADAIWTKQVKEEVKREVLTEVTKTTDTNSREQLVAAELSGYKELVPEVWDKTSTEHAKVAAEYADLVRLGHPESKITEATALRNVFGKLPDLRVSKAAKPGSAETHAETGGGNPGSGQVDVVKGLKLTPREKAHYERQISNGVYKGWDDVKAERAGYAGRRAR